MSTTATGVNYKQILIDQLQMIGETYTKDLGFIPEDKQGESPMGKARTAIEFTAECAGFNYFVAGLIRGDTAAAPSAEERAAYMASLNTGAKASEALKQSIQLVISALNDISDEDLSREVTMPWGSTVPLHRAASMCAGHMMYHCGQLNYIQSLFGDDANHWE